MCPDERPGNRCNRRAGQRAAGRNRQRGRAPDAPEVGSRSSRPRAPAAGHVVLQSIGRKGAHCGRRAAPTPRSSARGAGTAGSVREIAATTHGGCECAVPADEQSSAAHSENRSPAVNAIRRRRPSRRTRNALKPWIHQSAAFIGFRRDPLRAGWNAGDGQAGLDERSAYGFRLRDADDASSSAKGITLKLRPRRGP